MSLPLISAGPLALFLIITIIYSNFFMSSEKNKILKSRQKQAKEFSTSAFRSGFRKFTNKRVKYSRREKVEILCQNAGFDIKYSDYLLLCIIIALVLFVLFTFVINNPFMGIMFAALGFSAPSQILGLIRNKRVEKLEKQLAPFMNMVCKRYPETSNMEQTLIDTTRDFYGTEPLYTELKKTVAEMGVGVPAGEALDNLSLRTANKYVGLLADFYKIASSVGSRELRENLVKESYNQYEENRKLKVFLKEQISEPVRDSYLMVAAYPIFVGFGIVFMDGYREYMFYETVGQIVFTAATGVILGIVFFINKVIGAPLNKPYTKDKKSLESENEGDEV